jgi:hypothetical protein
VSARAGGAKRHDALRTEPLPSEHRYRQEFLAELLAHERLEVGAGRGVQAGASAAQEGVGLPHADE